MILPSKTSRPSLISIDGRFPANKDVTCYLFFDEIQRIDQWELFIRRVLDTKKVRIFLTGSSSKLLSSEIATSLRGRLLATEIFPFSFREYLKARGVFAELPKNFGSRSAAKSIFCQTQDFGKNGPHPGLLGHGGRENVHQGAAGGA